MPISTSEGDPRAAIRARALELGFDAVGFARAETRAETRARLRDFLAAGQHGDMGWMAETAVRRETPRAMWAEARSVIALGLNYGPAHDPLAILNAHDCGAVSVYAQNADYHDVLKTRLKTFAREIAERFSAQVKIFVDTAPLMEKPLAEAAGIGWQGKHTNLVSRDFGSWLFLGEVLTDLDHAPDTPHTDHCGACRACLDICPTDAFPAPYRLDARRCISYLTIEHRGPIDRALRPLMGNRIYGCDDCLAVCPWNKFAKATAEPRLQPRAELTRPHLAELAGLDDPGFRAVFAGSPVKRIGRARFVRNVLIAIGNSGDRALCGKAAALLDDAEPLVRGAAVWALGRLDPARAAAERRRRANKELDETVRAEWDALAAG